jgi:hypothetical protein
LKQLFYLERKELQSDEQKLLSMCIGKKYFSFAITSLPDNNLCSLGYFTNDFINDLFLRELFSKHAKLNDQFSQVLAIFDQPESVLVPASIHQNNTGLLAESIHGRNLDARPLSDSLHEWELNNIYFVPGNPFNWLKNKFPSLSYTHIYNSLLRSHAKAMNSATNDDTNGCFLIDFKSEDFSVIALRGENILLAQTYSYSTPADVIFHLLKICRHFSLSQQKVRLLLSGLVGKQSALLHDLSQFFLHMDFKEASDWATVISTDTDNQPHYFATLNDLSKCAS